MIIDYIQLRKFFNIQLVAAIDDAHDIDAVINPIHRSCQTHIIT